MPMEVGVDAADEDLEALGAAAERRFLESGRRLLDEADPVD